MSATAPEISLRPQTGGRPGAARLLVEQVGYAARELWRSRTVLVFTFILPLVWLLIIGFLAGNEAVDQVTGVRVMQFVTPTAAAMGLLFATYPPVANSLALAREQRILKRLRGTPLPPWLYLAGRVGGALLLAASAIVLMLLVGVLAYDVEILWRTALATVVTLVVGIFCLAALGLAVAAVSPSAAFAQAFSMGSAVVLTFLSGLFTIGTDPPAWMDGIGAVFPLRHLATALQNQFNPFETSSGWDLRALAVMAAWGIGGLLLANRTLNVERRTSDRAGSPAGPYVASGAGPSEPGRPTPAALVLDQARWATRAAWRDPGWVFFAVVMPIGLYAFMTAQYGESGLRPAGMDFALFFACGMAAYGAAVTAFINMPEAVASARDRGILKRLRGTPLQPMQYLAGRTASVLWIALLTALLVLATGILFFDVRLSASGLPLAILVVLLGTLTLAACGYALAAVAPSSKGMAAIGLGILLPLSFFSDVFLIGNPPAWMGAVGSLFPLKHFVHGLASALDPAGATVAWGNLAVMAAWLVGATAVAVRWFRWDSKV